VADDAADEDRVDEMTDEWADDGVNEMVADWDDEGVDEMVDDVAGEGQAKETLDDVECGC